MAPRMANLEIPAAFREQYEPLEKIGAGSFSAVVRARQRSLDRLVVAKLFWSKVYDSEAVDARVVQEARILAGIQHPRVVQLLDHGRLPGFVYLVYPDEAGVSLNGSDLRAGKAGLADAVRVLREILEGLEVIHDAGVVHRDLKPGNVLVTPGGGVKLIDFGLAKDLVQGATLTATGVFLGTPRYAAPEQIVGDLPDARDDLYAAGVIGYELLTGENPFGAPSIGETIERHLNLVPPPPHEANPAVPEDLSRWVMGLLEKEREDRPGSAALASAALARCGVRGAPPRPSRTQALPREGGESAAAVRPEVASSRRVPAWVPAVAGVVLGYALGAGRAPPAPADLPAPPPPPEAAAPPEVVAVARRVEARVEALLAGPETIPRDPRERERVWREYLPDLRTLEAWRDAGAPGDGPATRDALRDLDLALDRAGITAPFSAWLRAAPLARAEPFPAPLAFELARRVPTLRWPGEVAGASGRGFLALGVALREEQMAIARIRQVLADEISIRSVFPVDGEALPLMGWSLVQDASGRAEAKQWARGYCVVARHRPGFEDFLREGTDAAHAAFHAAAAGLARGDPGAPALAVAITLALDERELPWLARLGFLRSRVVLGPGPDDPFRDLLESVHLLHKRKTQENLTRLEPSPLHPAASEGDRPIEEALEGALREPHASPFDMVRVGWAAKYRAKLYSWEGDQAALRRFAEAHADALAGAPPVFRREVRKLAGLSARGPASTPGPPPDPPR